MTKKEVATVPAQVRAIAIAHAAHMAKPMLATPMVNQPHIADVGPDALLIRRACQYATAMLVKAGKLKGDLSKLNAEFHPPAKVVFVRANARQTVVAR